MAKKPNLKALELNLGYSRGFPVDRQGNERKALDEYYKKNTYPKSIVVNGKSKRVRWDKTTNKIYNEKHAKEQVNLKLYKTKTPDQDYEYLNLEREIQKKTKTGPAGFRKALSFKSDDETVVEQEHRQWLARQTEKLNSLRSGTSFKERTMFDTDLPMTSFGDTLKIPSITNASFTDEKGTKNARVLLGNIKTNKATNTTNTPANTDVPEAVVNKAQKDSIPQTESEVKQKNKNDIQKLPENTPVTYLPDLADLNRQTGLNIKSDKEWQSLVKSNQVFDTTSMGSKGGYFVNDINDVPRFIKAIKSGGTYA